MAKRKYWKVLDADRISARIGFLYGGIEYPPNQWVTPTTENSKLMVFKTKKNALKFAKTFRQKVVKCYAKKTQSKNLKVCNCLVHLKEFWINPELKKSHSANPPEGTIFADAVYCLE